MKKTVAFFFLFVFCISLPGFSVELHYCKGEVTDISFFGEANCVCNDSEQKQTEVSTETATCEKHCHKKALDQNSEKQIKKDKKCCKTEILTITSSKLKANSSTKTVEIIALVAVINPFLLTDLVETRNPHTVPYLPPLFQRDLLVLNSVFII